MNENNNVPELRFPGFEGEWGLRFIGSVLTIGSGKDYKHLGVGDVPVYGTGGYMLSVNDYLYDGKSVCIGRKGTIDKPRFVEGKFWTVDTLFYTHSYKNSVPEFVYGVFQKINWQKFNEASGVPSLSKTTIEKIKIYLPVVEEQQKIADFLSAVDKKIEQLTEKHRLLTQYKKGVMQQIFSQQIRFKDDEGNEYPEWEEKRLGDLGSFKSGTGFPDAEQGGFNGVPFYKVSDMNLPSNERSMSVANNYVSDEQVMRLKFKVIELPSIIFAKVGAAIFLERKREAVNFLIDNNMMAFTPDENISFFRHLFSILRLSKFAQVGALPSYNAGDLKIIKVNLPCIEEQQKIADFLSAIDNKIDQAWSKLEQTKAFKKGLLQKMFV